MQEKEGRAAGRKRASGVGVPPRLWVSGAGGGRGTFATTSTSDEGTLHATDSSDSVASSLGSASSLTSSVVDSHIDCDSSP